MRKRKPVLLNGEALMADGKVLEFDAVDQEELDGKIDAPQVANVGEVLTVEEVDEDGKPIKWKTQTVETEPPDWNENDPTKPGYVKNRTHYKYDNKFIGTVEFTATSENTLVLKDQSVDADGVLNIYNGICEVATRGRGVIKVIVRERMYTSNANYSYGISSLDGEFNWSIGGSIGYGSSASILDDHIALVAGKIYEVQFYNDEEIYKTLDEKYLPNTIFSQSNAPVKFGTDKDGKLIDSAVQGYKTTASGNNSHAEGWSTIASGNNSHAEGCNTTVSGNNSHAEGWSTIASGNNSHAEGCNTIASEGYSHVSGKYNIFETGDYSYQEIYTSFTVKKGITYYVADFFEFDTKNGVFTLSNARVLNFAESAKRQYISLNVKSSLIYRLLKIKSQNSTSVTYQVVKINSATFKQKCMQAYSTIIGNGYSDDYRSNAHTLDWEGNAWFAGDVYVGSTSGTNKDEGSVKLATEDTIIPIPATAQVGQIVKVKSVDESGKITETETVDMPTVSNDYELVFQETVAEDAASYMRDTDKDGNPFSLTDVMLIIFTKPFAESTNSAGRALGFLPTTRWGHDTLGSLRDSIKSGGSDVGRYEVIYAKVINNYQVVDKNYVSQNTTNVFGTMMQSVIVGTSGIMFYTDAEKLMEISNPQGNITCVKIVGYTDPLVSAGTIIALYKKKGT